MKKIFANLAPYWYMMVLIIALLCVQAYCDLSLPQYTSDIIDVGIQNKGVEHSIPQKITKEDYEYAQLYMNESEKKEWKDSFDKKEDLYERKNLKEKELDNLDDELFTPILLVYQLGNLEESQFKEIVKKQFEQNEQTKAQAEKIDQMSLEEIEKMMQTKLSTFKAEDENGKESVYVDMRPMMAEMIASGKATQESMNQTRKEMEEKLDEVGSSTLSAMGAKFALDCDKKAGVDIEKRQKSYLWTEGAKMLVMALIMLIMAIGVGYFAARIGAGIGKTLRNRVFEKVVGFSNSEINQFSTASLITRSTNDIQQVQLATTMMIRIILYAPIIGIGGIIKVIHTGAGMGWIIVCAVLVILGFVGVLMGFAMPKFKIMQKLVDKVNLISREILTGLSVIRAFGREKTEEKRFDGANRELTKTQLFTNRVMTFMMPGMMMIMYGITLLIVWVGAHRIDGGTLQVGSMTAFITYSMMIVMSFLMLTMLSIMLPRAGVAADRIDEVLRTETTIKEKEQLEEHMGKTSGIVEFRNVNFKYPKSDGYALENINFTAKPGQTTAIIGSTGCGKSTLVQLIPRFYDVTEGQITLDGTDIRDLSLKDLRNSIGYVPQKGVLFSGTIESNLKFGKEDATQAQIEEAAQIAQASEFIEEKKDKYQSSIAQGGSNVSGGQKQRLAIARAIVKNPAVYVFDDSFSALDMKTDAILRKELEKKTKNSSVIIVAQRISTIMHADQILVLEEGKIAGIGTHQELLKNCPVYLQIAKSQLSDKELGLESGKEE